MSEVAIIIIMIAVAGLAAGAGWLAARMRSQKRITALETTLGMERAAASEKLAEVEKTFATLSQQALQSNSQTFLDRKSTRLNSSHSSVSRMPSSA